MPVPARAPAHAPTRIPTPARDLAPRGPAGAPARPPDAGTPPAPVSSPVSAPALRLEGPLRILVVDGSRLQRRLLESQIARWGYDVAAVADHDAALRAVRDVGFDIVLSDWTLGPGGGIDLCQALRALGGPYVYFILLAAQAASGRIAEGLNAGADDFLSKPATAEELAARIAAGARLLAAQRALADAHARTDRALAEARALAAVIERDLDEARRLQMSLQPPAHAQIHGVRLSSKLCTSGRVGGDLLGWTSDPSGGLSIYAVDVSGHGIASALMAARLKGALSGDADVMARSGGRHSPQPHCVAARLNELARREISTEHYFTMLFARLEPGIGRLRFVQAGHPPPLLLRADGSAAFLGDGGLPVGLVEDARWRRREVMLAPGDRLLLYSDGVSECEARGALLGEEGLLDLAGPLRTLSGPALLDGIVDGLRTYSGRADFADDVSMILLDVPASPRRPTDG